MVVTSASHFTVAHFPNLSFCLEINKISDFGCGGCVYGSLHAGHGDAGDEMRVVIVVVVTVVKALAHICTHIHAL